MFSSLCIIYKLDNLLCPYSTVSSAFRWWIGRLSIQDSSPSTWTHMLESKAQAAVLTTLCSWTRTSMLHHHSPLLCILSDIYNVRSYSTRTIESSGGGHKAGLVIDAELERDFSVEIRKGKQSSIRCKFIIGCLLAETSLSPRFPHR